MLYVLVDAWSDDDVHAAVEIHRDVINGSLHRIEVPESSSMINVDGGKETDPMILRSVEPSVIQCADPFHPHEKLSLMHNDVRMICCRARGHSLQHERHPN